MRVTITDKEALRALSWAAVKTYLDAAGWQRADEIPGKAIMYQHTDKDGRLWEISVLLRDDLADYVSRMGDAVTILARIEDRSELDVYEDLRALGTGSAQHTKQPALVSNGQSSVVDDAGRAVHERIRRWLAEENWDVRDVPDPLASFNVMATLKGGPNVNIFQLKDHADHLTLSQRWVFDERLRSDVSKLAVKVQKDIVWNIYRDVSMMGVEFSGFKIPPSDMAFFAYVYFDGLTKDILVQRVLLTIRALHLAIRTFMRAFEEHNQSVDAAASLLRVVPPTDGPLTVAS